MLDGRRYDMVSFLFFIVSGSHNGQIVRFGSAAGEVNLRRIGADQIGDFFAGLFYGCFGLAAKIMYRTGVAINFF